MQSLERGGMAVVMGSWKDHITEDLRQGTSGYMYMYSVHKTFKIHRNNECTKSANPRCLYDGHCTMHRTEIVPSMHACPSSFDYGYIHDNFEMKLT